MRRLGVLGGMGPEATVDLMARLQRATPARDDADHVPLIVDMNPQVPSRIAHLIEKTGPDPGPVLAAMAARLEGAGAEALILPCNTAHHYADAITGAVAIPLLHMPALTCDALARVTGGAVGVLASPATRAIGLFEPLLAARGLSALWPEDEAPVLAAIRAIKARGPTEEDATLLTDQARALAARGAGAILVGCTEFSLLSGRIAVDVPVVDALDVLVDAALAFARD